MEETTLLKLDKVEICREENVILHEASFTLHNGEFVYVIGKVGSGKSSLLKSLYCEIPINQGDAWLLDYNLCKMKRQESGIRAESHRMEKEKRDKRTYRQRAVSSRNAGQRLQDAARAFGRRTAAYRDRPRFAE